MCFGQSAASGPLAGLACSNLPDGFPLLTDKGVGGLVQTPLWLCEQRDPKGLYKLARTGKLPNFTGISDRYDIPDRLECPLWLGALDSQGHERTPHTLMQQCWDYLEVGGYLARPGEAAWGDAGAMSNNAVSAAGVGHSHRVIRS